MKHSFPSRILNHSVILADWSEVNVLVSPSETFGHALARLGFTSSDVRAVSIASDFPYEPDFTSATR